MPNDPLPPFSCGPFYRCQDGTICEERGDQKEAGTGPLQPPGLLHYIQGQWLCWLCFSCRHAYGIERPYRDFHDAQSLADRLASDPGRWRHRTAVLLQVLDDAGTRYSDEYRNEVSLIVQELANDSEHAEEVPGE